MQPARTRRRLSRLFNIGLPYFWLGLFFLLPFVIVLRISIAEPALAQPPYTALWEWVEQTVKGEITTHNVTVTLYDVSGQQPLRTWVFQDAFPIKWGASALSADQNAIAIETLVMAHQGMSFAQ